MRLLLASCVLVALVVPARAARRRSGPMPPLRIELTLGATQRATDDSLFSGTGHPPGGSDAPVVASGRALGFVRPTLFQASLHILYGLRHFGFGAVVSGMFGDADRPAVSYAGIAGRTLDGFAVGPELRTMWQHEWFEASLGLSFGYEWLSIPLTGLEPHACGRGGRCYPTADSDHMFLEPRLALGVHVGSFVLGAYGGGDVLPGGGFSAGGFIGLASDAWSRRAEVRPRAE